MLTMTGRRYPLDQLQAEAGLTRRQLRTALGLSNDQLVELEQRGLDEYQADRYALRVDLDAWQVWPTWFADGQIDEARHDPDHPCFGRALPPCRSSCEQP